MWQELIKRIGLIVVSLGFDPRRFYYSIVGLPRFCVSYIKFSMSASRSQSVKLCPVLSDLRMPAGALNNAYFHMDLWAAKIVYEGCFGKIIDVGSRVDGFVAHVLTFREISVADIRPLDSSVENLNFVQMNFMSELTVSEKYDCVTSLHALEHFGLGRYGDPLNVDGWKIGLANLVKLLQPSGVLLLAVPVGRERVEFNAHRVFYPRTIVAYGLELGLKLEDFRVFTDDKKFCKVDDFSELELFNSQVYACGCFKFKLSSLKNSTIFVA